MSSRRPLTASGFDAAAFWETADKSRGELGCWIWKGARKGHGYGAFRRWGMDHGAHRVACVLVHGRIPARRVVMHLCDTKRCVNPDHLRIATNRENLYDYWEKFRPLAMRRIARGKKRAAERRARAQAAAGQVAA